MVMNIQAQTDYVKAITEIAAAMPLARTVQLYEYALTSSHIHCLPKQHLKKSQQMKPYGTRNLRRLMITS